MGLTSNMEFSITEVTITPKSTVRYAGHKQTDGRMDRSTVQLLFNHRDIPLLVFRVHVRVPDIVRKYLQDLSKIQIGFTFLVPAHSGSPGKRAVKRVCVCVPTGSNLSNAN